MRAIKTVKRKPKSHCIVCKHGSCVDENPGYSGRVTRSITKFLDHINGFGLMEVYRCMPLLGDEEKIPNWDVHIVRYAVVFMKKQ